jgi:hypothetical protein
MQTASQHHGVTKMFGNILARQTKPKYEDDMQTAKSMQNKAHSMLYDVCDEFIKAFEADACAVDSWAKSTPDKSQANDAFAAAVKTEIVLNTTGVGLICACRQLEAARKAMIKAFAAASKCDQDYKSQYHFLLAGEETISASKDWTF